MPQGAEVLTVEVPNGEPTLYAKVNTNAPNEPRFVHVVSIDQNISALKGRLVGSFCLEGVVFHVFER